MLAFPFWRKPTPRPSTAPKTLITNSGNFHRGYSFFAATLIAAFLGQSVHILFFKDPVTLWDAIFAILLAVLIWRTKGNVAKLIWSTT
ncbi:phage holin family protein [Bacillus sp. D-CC]